MVSQYTGEKVRVRRARFPLTGEFAWRVSKPGCYYLVADGLHFPSWHDAIEYATATPVDVTRGRWRITASYAEQDNVTIYRDDEPYRTLTYPGYKIWNLAAHVDEIVADLEQREAPGNTMAHSGSNWEG